MSVAPSVAEILKDHVTLEVESIDRMYLNVIVPQLQFEKGIAAFFRFHRGHAFASSALMEPMTRSFVESMERFCAEGDIEVVAFQKGQRKDDVMAERLKTFEGDEGVVFVGKAQEKTRVIATRRRRNPATGRSYAWLVPDSRVVNHWYWYCVDADFGPFFLKFSTYFPYNAKLCINGHEYLKRQLDKEGIAYEALDNGVLSCDDPERLQHICDGFGPRAIERLLNKWLKLLPFPFTARDQAAGYRYKVFVLQSEFSLTQVLDRPLSGRQLFEQVISENLDLGRPDKVGLVFGRRIPKPTRKKYRFRTRVITEGVVPSIHVDYKHSKVKQYHKLGRALRTETTINDPRDFGIRKGLQSLPMLRQIGLQANRRLLSVETISHDCRIGEDAYARVSRPVEVSGQRAPALRFGEPVVQALLHALVVFRLHLNGFTVADLREHLAPLLGVEPQGLTQGRMTYHLRRLRLHGLIERIPRTRRYRVTQFGFRVAFLYTRTYTRVLRTGLTCTEPEAALADNRLQTTLGRIDALIGELVERARLAA